MRLLNKLGGGGWALIILHWILELSLFTFLTGGEFLPSLILEMIHHQHICPFSSLESGAVDPLFKVGLFLGAISISFHVLIVKFATVN